MVQVREIVRLRLQGKGFREIASLTGIDRKTVRRYVEAAEAQGLFSRPEGALGDASVGAIISVVNPIPGRPRGDSWADCEKWRDFIKGHLDKNVRLTKIRKLIRRQNGPDIPYATLNRFAIQELGFGHQRVTVRVDDGEAGGEVQVDFGRMGLLPDPATGRRRICWALIFTAVFSRHLYAYLTFDQSLQSVIAGFERAWDFFGGVFLVAIPDNMKAIVTKADPIKPLFNEAFQEYAQSCGFAIDTTRVRSPKDKPRVENVVPFVREDLFGGEEFRDIFEAQSRADVWCMTDAGLRIHRTTQRRPLEVFEAEERPLLLPAPVLPFDIPIYADAKVARDHHIQVAKALYSLPTRYIGDTVRVRADQQLVRIYLRGQVIKTHPRKPPGGRSTDPTDYPPGRGAYATRDIDYLEREAKTHGPAIGIYAERLLDTELPWTRMRQVYKLLGLVRSYGETRVNEACERALGFDVVDVRRLEQVLKQAAKSSEPSPPQNIIQLPLRFARPIADFAIRRRREEEENNHE
ncbi:MAG: IS21 family transposase [Chloroflexi bacterium]|nr:IS21 family transposase [Chloroflexota bacterium]